MIGRMEPDFVDPVPEAVMSLEPRRILIRVLAPADDLVRARLLAKTIEPFGVAAWAGRLRRIEAASRPDPDPITVNLPADVHRRFAHRIHTARDVDAVALAAAGLPQEPTEGGES